jgi:hypothetical protein
MPGPHRVSCAGLPGRCQPAANLRGAMGYDSSSAAGGVSPRVLPEGLFVLWRSCGVACRPIGDLEQAGRAYGQAREGRRI